MRRTIRLAAAALFFGQAALALAQTPDTFFGPRQYDHPDGGSSYAVDDVAVPEGVVGPFTLNLRNGGAEERTRVEAAWIFVNGVQVAGPRDFDHKVREFGRTVQLQPQNRLVVIIRGRPRTFLTLSLSGTLSAPTVVSLLPVNAAVTLGATATLGLTITPAQPVDTVVPLDTGPAGIVTVPASVTVPAGQTKADVPVGTIAFGQAGVTAQLNGSSASALVNVVPQSLQVVSIVPSAAHMNVGAKSAFTVNINAVQNVDRDIALSVDAPGVLQVPASATVAAGTTSATFAATAVTAGDAIVTAAANGTQRTASVHVSPAPAAVVSLEPNPLSLQQGSTSNLTVTINVAQEGDTLVDVASDVPAVAGVPTTVTIPAGSVSALIGVRAVASGSANVTASVNGTSAAAAVLVSPPPPVVTEIAPATLTLAKGTPGTLTVRVSRAPSAATAVTLVSSAPAVASVPAVMNVPAGATSIDFPVASNDAGQAIITASLNDASASATVTVAPAELASLSLSPQAPAATVGQTVQFSAAGTLTDGTTQDFTTRVSWLTSDTTATIDANGLATAVLPGSPTVTARFSFVPAGTAQPVTVTQSTTLTIAPPAPPPAFLTISGQTTTTVGTTSLYTIFTSAPAPAGGLLAALTITGGAFNGPTSVLIPAGATSGNFGFTPLAAVAYSITASAPSYQPASLAVTAVPPPARPTHAHITARNGTPVTQSSPVTPFVPDANPGDRFTIFGTVSTTNGNAKVIENQLVYTATTAGFSGADQFPYQVLKADGSTLDGTARVRVYPATGANSLVTCTRNSAINAGALNRTQAASCAFYAEVVTRIGATGAATVKYLVARPSSGAAPKAAVFLIGGGDLDMSIAGDATTGVPSGAGGNFLVRTTQLFADAGYLAIAMQRPSDVPSLTAPDSLADIDRYRISVRHAVDILAVLREENTDNLPVFIAGTSRGAISVVANNMIATGISISSPVTRASPSNPALLFVNDPRFASLQPSFVQRPAHVLWNTSDLCGLTRPVDSQALFNNLVAAGVVAASDAVTGGFVFDNGTGIDQCGGLSPHQYLGIEKTQGTVAGAATAVTAWLDSRMAALGGDRHPDAAFATLSTGSGASLQVDLATLARDADGDPLSYALSHAATSLGGGVSLSGSTVTYTPPAGVTSGTDYFVYVVTDGRGGVGAAVITVKIGN